MLISKTPYRISFFGGGTDYPSWYEKHGGAVLSTTINHYCYITARFLPPFFPNKSRIVWNKIEEVLSNDEIQHPSIRACLKYLNITDGVEIHTTGDLPSRSGLGSSSAFTVGLLNCLLRMNGNVVDFGQLASEAIHIEREVLKENVGIQDQIAAAYGGLNCTIIHQDGIFEVRPVVLLPEKISELEDHLLLFFTGVSRSASDIAASIVEEQAQGHKVIELKRMQDMALEALMVLRSNDIFHFGTLLHESWLIKRSLTKNISPEFVDSIYERGRKAGAIGGKLLGAGGGGFMLFFAKPEDHDKIRSELSELLWVPFKFSDKGSEIIYDL